jgi:hypothetical protein
MKHRGVVCEKCGTEVFLAELDFFMQSSFGGNPTSNWLESASTLHRN